MQGIRKYMAWIFAITSLVCLWIDLRYIGAILRHLAPLPHPNVKLLIVPAVLSTLTVVFGMAWWTTWKEKPHARGWGTAASLINTLLPVWHIVYFRPYNSDRGATVATIGIAGLIAFLWPIEATPEESGFESENNPS
jgi:hypothetical protein